MSFAANIVIALFVALLHLYFLVLEMFLWDKPVGLGAATVGRNILFVQALPAALGLALVLAS